MLFPCLASLDLHFSFLFALCWISVFSWVNCPLTQLGFFFFSCLFSTNFNFSADSPFAVFYFFGLGDIFICLIFNNILNFSPEIFRLYLSKTNPLNLSTSCKVLYLVSLIVLFSLVALLQKVHHLSYNQHQAFFCFLSFSSFFHFWPNRAAPSLLAECTVNFISVLSFWRCPCAGLSFRSWKKIFAIHIAFSWQNSISLSPALFQIEPTSPIIPDAILLPTLAFQSPRIIWKMPVSVLPLCKLCKSLQLSKIMVNFIR